MSDPPRRQDGRCAGGASRGVRGCGAPPESPVLRNGISIEPNRSTEPNMAGTEPTEPSTALFGVHAGRQSCLCLGS
eukprot:15483662-Alexandrium_andersonii.AAC.1